MAHEETTTAPAWTRSHRARSGRVNRTGHARRRPTAAWYATDLTFQSLLARGLHTSPEHRGATVGLLRRDALRRHEYRVLVYRHPGLDVPGRRHRVPVEVQFYEDPAYVTYGLEATDYPRVVADPGAESKHRMPDDALCLWYPRDPEDRRWKPPDGLVELFEIVRHHLLYEDYWRETGGRGDGHGKGEGVWLGDEAPHGFPGQETDAA